jgi:hypothetical protein
MNKEQLGFDPRSMITRDERLIGLERDDHTEWLAVDNVSKWTACVVDWAMTCGEVVKDRSAMHPCLGIHSRIRSTRKGELPCVR